MDINIDIAEQEEALRNEYADYLAEQEFEAQQALEERTRDALIAAEQLEIERRQAAEAEEYRLDQEWKAEQLADLGGEPEPDNGLPDTDVPPFFGTSLADEICGMEYAAQCARRDRAAAWRSR